LVLLPAWLGLVYLFSREQGLYFVLVLIVLVAAADIGAYFAGRQWGQHKLAIKVSPGKTWEGFFGGLSASVACVFAMWLMVGDPRFPLAVCLVIGLLTSLSSVVGDLLESMVKRHAGEKDSGTILPGHGGILDRIDGITAASPVFSLGLLLAGI
jgi:phosphatidate cytidylyltransferase